jgi:hypothetical protein
MSGYKIWSDEDYKREIFCQAFGLIVMWYKDVNNGGDDSEIEQ